MKSKKKLAQKYAFNLAESKGVDGREVDLNRMNTGFYDDIEEKDLKIKRNQQLLELAKAATIKESIYSNKAVPNVWRTKLTYQDEMLKIISRDPQFLYYLAKTGTGSEKAKRILKREIQPGQDNPTISLSPQKSTDCIERNLSKISQINHNESLDKSYHYNYSHSPQRDAVNCTQYSGEELDSPRHHKVDSPRRRTTLRPKNIQYTEKMIDKILEEYKSVYRYKNFTDGKTILQKPKVEFRYPDIERKTLSKSQALPVITYPLLNNQSMYSQFSIIRDNHLNASQKSSMFKLSIYNKLIPNQSEGGSDSQKSKKMPADKNLHKSKFGPYLNFNYEEFNKKIAITNPKIKTNLEEIQYFGPFFSHCPSCRNKNLEFYQTLETNQCLKLLNHIKKVRLKPKELVDKPKKDIGDLCK